PQSSRFRAFFALAALFAVASCDRSPAASAPGEVQFATGASLPAVPGFAARANIQLPIAHKVTLSWEDVAGEDIYLVQWRVGDAGAWKTLVTTGRDRTTYGTDSVRVGQRNYYRIAAMTSAFQAGPFTTVLLAPSVLGSVIQQRGDSVASLRSEFTDYGPLTTTWIEYGTDPGLADAVETARITPEEGRPWWNFMIPIVSGTRYYYRAVATSDAGTALDSIRTFVGGMAEAPIVELSYHDVPWDSSWMHLPAYRVQVDWTQPPGGAANTYGVERRRLGQTAWTLLTLVTGEVRRYVDTSIPLSSGARYEYRVDACNPACIMSQPDTVTVAGMPAPPNLTATLTPSGSVVLAWGDLAHEDAYIIQYRADSTAAWKTLVTTGPSRVTYTATQVAQGVNQFRVAGMGSGFRTGAWASASVFTAWTLSATTGAGTPLPGAAALSGTVTATGLPASAWFEWGTSPTLATYASTPAVPVSGSGVPVSDTITVPGPGSYYYRVAFSNGEHTGRSEIRRVGVGLPPAPVLTASFSRTGWVVYLSWTHSGAGDPATFRIYRGTTLLREVPAAGRTFTDVQVFLNSSALTYTYRVDVCNAAGHCTAGSPRTVSITPMPGPQGFTATALSDGQVQLQWQDLPGDQYYVVYWRTDLNGPWETLPATGANATTYTTAKVTPGVTNYYLVVGFALGNRPGEASQTSVAVP
ncbi:MAG TPA: hypothetical protein VFY65_15615, partial [Longimicrobium sp.]|nr:hypothetical protein [Longimicrobium sp.]